MMKKYSKPNTQNNYNSIEVKIGVKNIRWFGFGSVYNKHDYKSDTLKLLEVAYKWLEQNLLNVRC